ncbi:hypothetical protein J6590_055291 [Homalodisca vitripennis]|nr:hypothetical protein J6590_055291 [Homalodisca vitripennis]
MLWALKHMLYVPTNFLRFIESYLTGRILLYDTTKDQVMILLITARNVEQSQRVDAGSWSVSGDQQDKDSAPYEEENSYRVPPPNGQRPTGDLSSCLQVSFYGQVYLTADKAAKAVAALGRLMPNVEGSLPCKSACCCHQFNLSFCTKLRFGSTIWRNMFTETSPESSTQEPQLTARFLNQQ